MMLRRARTILALVVLAMAVPSAVAAHPDHPDDPRRSVTVDPADMLSDGQAVSVTNRGFGVNMSGVRVEQCTADLRVCDPSNLVLTTTGRNGRFGPHDNPVNVSAPEVVAVPFRVKARFDVGGRSVDCVPTACVIQAGGGTEYARHAHPGFGTSLPAALRPVPPAGQPAGGQPAGGQGSAGGGFAPVPPGATGEADELPPGVGGSGPPADEGTPASTAATAPAGEDLAAGSATSTTRRGLELRPAASEGAWSILPVLIGAALVGAVLLLVLAWRRRTPAGARDTG